MPDWFNRLITAWLRSPLPWPACQRFLLLTVTGRQSGRTFTLPVFYRQDGDGLVFISHPDRLWWRNLRGGAPVTVRVCGRDRAGAGEVVDADLAARTAVVRRLYWMLPPARAAHLAATAVVLRVRLAPVAA